jgi:hypothetical protein
MQTLYETNRSFWVQVCSSVPARLIQPGDLLDVIRSRGVSSRCKAYEIRGITDNRLELALLPGVSGPYQIPRDPGDRYQWVGTRVDAAQLLATALGE